jgi:hypothetical protein
MGKRLSHVSLGCSWIPSTTTRSSLRGPIARWALAYGLNLSVNAFASQLPQHIATSVKHIMTRPSIMKVCLVAVFVFGRCGWCATLRHKRRPWCSTCNPSTACKCTAAAGGGRTTASSPTRSTLCCLYPPSPGTKAGIECGLKRLVSGGHAAIDWTGENWA